MKTPSYLKSSNLFSKFNACLLLVVGGVFSASNVSAGTFTELNLTVGMNVNSNGIKYHKTGTAECNPFGRSPDIEHFDGGLKTVTSTAGNGVYADKAESAVYELQTNYADAHWMSPRKLTVSVKNKITETGLVAEVRLIDAQNRSQQNTNYGTCSHTDWTAKADKDVLNGKIRIGYVMPENAWAVRVKRLKIEGLFARQMAAGNKSMLKPLAGMLNSEKDPRRVNEDFVAWAAPGTKLYQEFELKDVNEGGLVDGVYSLSFTPIVNSSGSDVSRTQFKDLYDAVSGATNGNAASFDPFVEQAVSLLASPTKLKSLVSDSKTTDVYRLTNALANLANQPLEKKGFWDVRAAASILSYEMSLLLLSDLGPYCNVESVNLPFSGKMNVSGMRLAFVYLSRAQSRLKNYRFGQYSAYLNQLMSYEKQGLTYSQVRTNPKSIQDLKTAYDLLKNSVTEITPFAAALGEIKYVLGKFKSVGAGEATTEKIVANLNHLAQVEDAFIRDFILRLRDFKASNSNPVRASDLQERLDQIVAAQSDVLELLDNNVRFLSIDDDADPGSFTGMIQTLISHNLSLFSKPLQWSTLERIRSVYKNETRYETVVTQAKKCLL